jgi:polysaccharide export outer membrane protein
MMSRIHVCLLFFLFALNSFAAQQSPEVVPSTTDNVMGPEDTLNIVAGEAEEISKTWRVSGNGDLDLPMIGRIHAAGLTAAQLEGQITEKLKAFIREPHVSVYISEFRSQPVTIEGAVARPGTIQTEGQKTLLNVLMMAGGPNAAGPTVTLTRSTQNGTIPLEGAKTDAKGEYSTLELKLKDVMNASNPAANLIMRPHDVLWVSTKQRLVYIIGQVNRPGAVELDTQDSVSAMQVLAAAGGLTSLAVPSNTAVMHVDEKGQYSKVASINLKNVMNGKGADRMLTPGDILVVPENHVKSYVQAATMSATTTGMYAILMHF